MENDIGQRSEIHMGFWWGNLKVRDHLEDLGRDWRIIIIIKGTLKSDWMV